MPQVYLFFPLFTSMSTSSLNPIHLRPVLAFICAAAVAFCWSSYLLSLLLSPVFTHPAELQIFLPGCCHCSRRSGKQ